MKTQQINENDLRQRVNDYCASRQISKKDLAQSLEISPAVLSFIQTDSWRNVSPEMKLRIWNFVKPVHEGWVLIETHNLTTIKQACSDARLRHHMVGIIGFTGSGKTTALTEYYRSHPNTYYIQCKASMKPRQFFHKLLIDMGVPYMGSIYDMIQRVSKELNSKHNPLLIIDEAGKLSKTMFTYLHDLKDNTEKNTGIILAGVEYFYSNLQKAVEKNIAGMPEFFRRVTTWQELQLPAHAEIRAIAEANEITDPSQVKSLLKCKDFGTLYNYINNLRLSTIEAAA